MQPLMNFDYDLEEDIDLSDFMFPEFGRRLRRAADVDDVFDAAAVRRLEAEWSSRRRRRSLLPGDENHVHDHHHEHEHEHEHAVEQHAKTCSIMGVRYELGEVIGVASDNCLECRCAAQAMFCSPKCCFFALEERLLREGRQASADERLPRPHPLQALLRQ
ncbi:uncharacterized protein LOC119107700 [Pollicipes pollicipes]|nr:uncharacterized protein LOC119107700 [Pollicipes pollicipes]